MEWFAEGGDGVAGRVMTRRVDDSPRSHCCVSAAHHCARSRIPISLYLLGRASRSSAVMQQVAMAWLVLSTHRLVSWLGWSIRRANPRLVLTPWQVADDRFDRGACCSTQTIAMLQALVLALLTLTGVVGGLAHSRACLRARA